MSLEELKQQRANTKKSISRIKNIVEGNARGEGKTLSSAELKCRLAILEAYFKQILTVQTNIEKLDTDDSCRADLEDLYISAKLAIQSQLGEDLHNISMSDSTCIMPIMNSKLPVLKLPTFSGRYSEYKNFITSFTQIIDRESGLSNLEKFNHLLTCLQGPALQTVKAFQITNENYPKALERLRARYDNNTLIFMETITALFDLPVVSKPHSDQLRSLVDNASALYGSLISLGSDKEISQAMLIHIIIERCDEGTRRKWKESLNFQKLPTWNDCTQTLERHCQYLQSLDKSRTNNNENRNNSQSTSKQGKPINNYSFACAKSPCPVCLNANHKIHNCERFKDLAVAQRFEHVKKLRLCINCLSKGHQLSNCPSTHRCRVCSRQHNSLLHRYTESTPDEATSHNRLSVHQTPPSSFVHSTPRGAVTHTHLDNASTDNVILATAMVLVQDSSGCYRLGRALLDSCSQVNFITDDFAQKLRLRRGKHNVEVHSIGNSSTNIKYKTSTTINSRCTAFELPMTFCITSHIAYQPESEIDISSWNLPPNIELADEKFYKSKRIDLLLGTETFFSILSVGQIKLGKHLPLLQKTVLGWVVSGRYQNSVNTHNSTCLLTHQDSIGEKLEHLWKLEEVSAAPDVWSREQHTCERLFAETVYRNVEGRVVVKLPFKDDPSYLGSSYTTALRRFIAQEHRLSRSPELRLKYVEFMQEYEKLGHMTAVSEPNLNEPHYYIPHHCVLKPSSTSTKLRVVFDASCRTTSQKSLNDIQMIGPTLQPELFILLLRFRLYRFAITADIVKMYRQVLVDPEHRRFQYILWRSSPDKEIRTFQLNTVTYGMAAAPYLAVRSLFHLADQHASQFETGARIIKSSFYVDDMVCGADSLDDLRRVKYEVKELLKLGGLELAKWHSNHQAFRDDTTIKNMNLDSAAVASALGLKWDQDQDRFLPSFELKHNLSKRVTKRSILSIASSLFDPLGLLAPVIITAKILLQELWLLKLDWDESVPQNLHSAWEHLLTSLSSISIISIPRYCLLANSQSVQLHGFCDASIRAYGCGIYTRTTDELGNIRVHLFTAKSRVAPIKKQSLPKLELCGALLLARLYNKVKPLFENTIVFLWTDSQIVLHWLKSHSATLSAFVGNRVSEIQDLTADAQWRHVPTHCNPADIVSRGSTAENLSKSIWFTGPSFLNQDAHKWPATECNKLDFEEINKEKRKSTFKATVKANYILEVIAKYSSHIHCLRVIAWIFRGYQRFNKSLTSTFETESPSPQELQHAFRCIIWNIQNHYFADDIRLLKCNAPITTALKYLNPFLEFTGGFELLKVGGRLELSDLPASRKHPILLPSKCEFVRSYVRHLHLKNYHAGPKALIALIRLEFWIINARDVARRVVRSCIHCVRYKPKLLQTMMGNLPIERLTPSRPFTRCGMDFCGPVNTYLRIRGKAPRKTYIAIFICFATKAIHMEIVSDLSTDAFLASLRRMIGRRGLPSDIFCDNATNFVGACNRLKDLKAFLFNTTNQNAIVKYCSKDFINFHFIPPRAPHFGGIWEAAVKSAKGHLNRSLMNTKLTFEELSTVVIEVEAILNSRPITPLSTDPSDYEALTPGHFLMGSALKTLPDRNVPTNTNHLEKWACVSNIKLFFWRKWTRDYVNELQMRTKWTNAQPNVPVNTMVIVHDDNMPPQRWQLGRIVNCVPGKDSLVRVVDIRTAKGVIRRPIHKLAALPL